MPQPFAGRLRQHPATRALASQCLRQPCRVIQTAYLSGNTRLADFEFARAKQEIASTARPDLMARAELMRCATRVASLGV
jgi:hypothetical protein